MTGLTQNVEELLKSDTARLMLANSEFLILLNQASTDREELAALLNISENQLSYITNVAVGSGLIRCSGNIVPFENTFPKLAWQGYNYGNGYIGWALQRGGYTEANALQFSQEQAASHGWSSYGDPEYVPHVMRYYSGGSLFAGLFGSQQIVSVAMGQIGNSGGQKFWS